MKHLTAFVIFVALAGAVLGYTYPQTRQFNSTTAWTNGSANRIQISRITVTIIGSPSNSARVWVTSGSTSNAIINYSSTSFQAVTWPGATGSPAVYVYPSERIVFSCTATNRASFLFDGFETSTGPGGDLNGDTVSNGYGRFVDLGLSGTTNRYTDDGTRLLRDGVAVGSSPTAGISQADADIRYLNVSGDAPTGTLAFTTPRGADAVISTNPGSGIRFYGRKDALQTNAYWWIGTDSPTNTPHKQDSVLYFLYNLAYESTSGVGSWVYPASVSNAPGYRYGLEPNWQGSIEQNLDIWMPGGVTKRMYNFVHNNETSDYPRLSEFGFMGAASFSTQQTDGVNTYDAVIQGYILQVYGGARFKGHAYASNMTLESSAPISDSLVLSNEGSAILFKGTRFITTNGDWRIFTDAPTNANTRTNQLFGIAYNTRYEGTSGVGSYAAAGRADEPRLMWSINPRYSEQAYESLDVIDPGESDATRMYQFSRSFPNYPDYPERNAFQFFGPLSVSTNQGTGVNEFDAFANTNLLQVYGGASVQGRLTTRDMTVQSNCFMAGTNIICVAAGGTNVSVNGIWLRDGNDSAGAGTFTNVSWGTNVNAAQFVLAASASATPTNRGGTNYIDIDNVDADSFGGLAPTAYAAAGIGTSFWARSAWPTSANAAGTAYQMAYRGSGTNIATHDGTKWTFFVGSTNYPGP